MRRVLVFGWMSLLACSGEGRETAVQPGSGAPLERELIPAEWTVAEDTSLTGEVTTVSVQLPAARDIADLLPDEMPRLVLRCLDGRVVAFIDTEPVDGTAEADSARVAPPVRIELDAAPSCE